MTVRIINADVTDGLAQLESESVHCVVTSPPYFGLRDYGMPGQIGLEPTPDAYVAKLVEVFRDVRRVLRKDGTCWLNLGDSYWGSWANYSGGERGAGKQRLIKHGSSAQNPVWDGMEEYRPAATYKHKSLKPKDLIGIPWRVAFALQADGWWLRQDIIWSKPNPMPESVTDRCTKAHEYIFLLTKAERYFYDAEAIAEIAVVTSRERTKPDGESAVDAKARGFNNQCGSDGTRNKRSVWEVTTQPFPEAHFATFPPALIEPCIKAGCPETVCAKCGAPHLRDISRGVEQPEVAGSSLDRYGDGSFGTHRKIGGQYQKWLDANPKITIGFSSSCQCVSTETISGTVLDPFGGSGTTGLVADRLKRNAILIELNPEYAAMAERRVKGDCPMFAEVQL